MKRAIATAAITLFLAFTSCGGEAPGDIVVCTMECWGLRVAVEPPLTQAGVYTVSIEAGDLVADCRVTVPVDPFPECLTPGGEEIQAIPYVRGESKARDLETLYLFGKPTTMRVEIRRGTDVVAMDTLTPTYPKASEDGCTCDTGTATLGTH